MAKKIFGSGMLVMVLALGMAVIGCDINNGVDSTLNGTWIFGGHASMPEDFRRVTWMNNGNFEVSWENHTHYNRPVTRGTFTTRGSNLHRATTHWHANFVAMGNPGSQPGTGWLTVEQYITIRENHMRSQGLNEEQIASMISTIRGAVGGVDPFIFSVSGNTLTLTNPRINYSWTYTRR